MNANSTDAGVLVGIRPGTVPAAVSAGTRNSAAVDRLAFDSCVLAASTGAASGTPTALSLAAKLQESTDGQNGWTDLPGAAVEPLTAPNAVARMNVRLSTARRYVRVVETVALTGGTAPTLGASSLIVLCGPDEIPAP
ncbi:hypothetical protein FJV41_22435 [Myxococcus llanfairpwllgwyngyllgogerychwyrndrobwllllantysiliogogogochensis]|uniref:Uncharacterized protein n=1 Tax=Myxococcus llanfairpwllgwyngyllgogerychwyrndrobwllllantysiliogogogochensis TaxID=2590453 RepID=A0A540WXK9_9BACT|nr:hypothetical protein [Myxococcus llanfairpwllgwyngyllgogerychwyrndrobwllllantysiliogogogochensis]TQF13731.1 hypothetical protein FJV41_22435 [Myxococcus llanfairpwllgwyngyllgogerychwyrndrobwllllantysiliogogogochensis]